MECCSFCGKTKDQVERLVQGLGKQALPNVFICDQCIGLCARIIGLVQPEEKARPEKLTDWAHVDVDGQTYRWSAVRTFMTTEAFGKPSKSEWTVMILVGKLGEEANAMMYPDGTEPSEQLAIEAVRTLLALE